MLWKGHPPGPGGLLTAHSRRSCPRGPVHYDSTGWECFQQTAASSQTCPSPLPDALGASDLTHTWECLPGPGGLNQLDLVSQDLETPPRPPIVWQSQKPRQHLGILYASIPCSVPWDIRCPQPVFPQEPGSRNSAVRKLFFLLPLEHGRSHPMPACFRRLPQLSGCDVTRFSPHNVSCYSLLSSRQYVALVFHS